MSNMIDYIKWRGDISFETDPLNEIDSLIFCEIAYIPLEKVIKDNTKGETIEVLAKRLAQLPEEETKIGAIIPEKDIKELFYLAGNSQRYKNIRIKWFVNNVCKKAEKQFCAMTFVIDKEYYYVAYRGTDDSIIGWKEDLNMAFNTPIPSQTEGVEYLTEIGEKTRKKIYVGGHSKGGNLAAYSAMFTSDKTKKKIVSVHSFDGPGFMPEFLKTIDDEETKGKIKKYLPQGSIIGMIFDPLGACEIVKSKGKGMYQHDAFNWEILGKSFVNETELLKSSINFHDILLNWTLSMEPNERAECVGAFYKLMTVNEAATLTDIASGKMKFILGVLKTDGKTKKILFSAINKLLKQRRKNKQLKTQEQIPPKKQGASRTFKNRENKRKKPRS